MDAVLADLDERPRRVAALEAVMACGAGLERAVLDWPASSKDCCKLVAEAASASPSLVRVAAERGTTRLGLACRDLALAAVVSLDRLRSDAGSAPLAASAVQAVATAVAPTLRACAAVPTGQGEIEAVRVSFSQLRRQLLASAVRGVAHAAGTASGDAGAEDRPSAPPLWAWLLACGAADEDAAHAAALGRVVARCGQGGGSGANRVLAGIGAAVAASADPEAAACIVASAVDGALDAGSAAGPGDGTCAAPADTASLIVAAVCDAVGPGSEAIWRAVATRVAMRQLGTPGEEAWVRCARELAGRAGPGAGTVSEAFASAAVARLDAMGPPPAPVDGSAAGGDVLSRLGPLLLLRTCTEVPESLRGMAGAVLLSLASGGDAESRPVRRLAAEELGRCLGADGAVKLAARSLEACRGTTVSSPAAASEGEEARGRAGWAHPTAWRTARAASSAAIVACRLSRGGPPSAEGAQALADGFASSLRAEWLADEASPGPAAVEALASAVALVGAADDVSSSGVEPLLLRLGGGRAAPQAVLALLARLGSGPPGGVAAACAAAELATAALASDGGAGSLQAGAAALTWSLGPESLERCDAEGLGRAMTWAMAAMRSGDEGARAAAVGLVRAAARATGGGVEPAE